MTEETGLFHIRFTEKGKQVVKRMANLSVFIMGLVFFVMVVNIYFQVKQLLRQTYPDSPMVSEPSLYFRIIPWVTMVMSVLTLVSNFYYAKFPRQLNRCLENNDEAGANNTFQSLLKGMQLFSVLLLLDMADLVLLLFYDNPMA